MSRSVVLTMKALDTVVAPTKFNLGQEKKPKRKQKEKKENRFSNIKVRKKSFHFMLEAFFVRLRLSLHFGFSIDK